MCAPSCCYGCEAGFRPAFALESAEDDRWIAASPTCGASGSLDERRMSMFRVGGFFYS